MNVVLWWDFERKICRSWPANQICCWSPPSSWNEMEIVFLSAVNKWPILANQRNFGILPYWYTFLRQLSFLLWLLTTSTTRRFPQAFSADRPTDHRSNFFHFTRSLIYWVVTWTFIWSNRDLKLSKKTFKTILHADWLYHVSGEPFTDSQHKLALR